MELKPGYKQTEVGVIPEDWDCVSIQSAASNTSNAIVGGPFGSDLTSSDYVYSGVPVVRGANMGSKMIGGSFVFVSTSKASALSANLAQPQDLVFTQRGTLGQVSLVPDEPFESYLISQSQMKVSLDGARYGSEYVYHYFSSAPGRKQILDSAIQTGVPHTNLGICRKYVFPAPCITEQEKICDVLNDIDSQLQLIGRLLDKKKQIKQAAMQELLTGKRRLPGFEGEWEARELGSLGIWRGGMTPSMQNPDYWNQGDFPWISSGDVKLSRLSDTSQHVTAHAVSSGAAVVIPVKSIVLVTRSGILRKHLPVAFLNRPMAINQDIKALIPARDIDSCYLLHALTWAGSQILISCMKTGTTVESVEFSWLKKFTILIPSHDEQVAIATALSEMESELLDLEARKDKATMLKQGMMHQLLTGKIRLK